MPTARAERRGSPENRTPRPPGRHLGRGGHASQEGAIQAADTSMFTTRHQSPASPGKTCRKPAQTPLRLLAPDPSAAQEQAALTGSGDPSHSGNKDVPTGFGGGGQRTRGWGKGTAQASALTGQELPGRCLCEKLCQRGRESSGWQPGAPRC